MLHGIVLVPLNTYNLHAIFYCASALNTYKLHAIWYCASALKYLQFACYILL